MDSNFDGSEMSNSVQGLTAGSSLPAAKRLAMPSRPPQSSSVTDAPTPSLCSDNDVDREEASPEEQLLSTPPIGPSRAFYRFRGNGIPVEEADGSHKVPDVVMSNSAQEDQEDEASSFIRVKPLRPRPNIFDKRPPSSPFPDKSPRRPKPPGRVSRVVEKPPPSDRTDEGSDDEDPLSLSFSSPDDLMYPRHPKLHKEAVSAESGSQQSTYPPRTASPSVSSHHSSSSQHKSQSSRQLTLEEEIRNAVHYSRDGEDEEVFESGVFVGVGTRSKRRGFLAHGGAGGLPVFMGVGYVEDAEEEVEDDPKIMDDAYIPPRARTDRRQ